MALLEQTEERPKSLALWTASMIEGKLAIPLTSLGGKLKAETTRNWACDSYGCQFMCKRLKSVTRILKIQSWKNKK